MVNNENDSHDKLVRRYKWAQIEQKIETMSERNLMWNRKQIILVYVIYYVLMPLFDCNIFYWKTN